QLGNRTGNFVVYDHVVEHSLLTKLVLRQVEALADLARALGRALAQPPVELGERRADEDRHRTRALLLDLQRSFGLELEHADAAGVRDAIHLGPERPVSLAGDVGDVLEELAGRDATGKFAVREKVVLAAVLLALTAETGRRRDGHLELPHALEQCADEGSLPRTRRAGDDEDGLFRHAGEA